jgi:hypothetical protein
LGSKNLHSCKNSSLSKGINLKRLIVVAVLALSVQGCAVIAVADAAVSVAATVVKTTAKVGGAVIGAAIPDSKPDEKTEEKK